MKPHIIRLLSIIIRGDPYDIYKKLTYLSDALEDRLTQNEKRKVIEILNMIIKYMEI